jgi:hypothetical protein
MNRLRDGKDLYRFGVPGPQGLCDTQKAHRLPVGSISETRDLESRGGRIVRGQCHCGLKPFNPTACRALIIFPKSWYSISCAV